MAYRENYRLRKPSGEYTVGCMRFEYEYEPKEKMSKRRIPCLCFYPSIAKDGLGCPQKYISDILWPGAGDILTNSYLDIPILPGKHPLIFHSHGLGSVLEENTVQFEELASNGYIVLSYGHEGSGAYEMENGDVLIWDSKDYFDELNATKGQRDLINKWFVENGAKASTEEQMRRYQAYFGLRSYASALVDIWVEDGLAALDMFLGDTGDKAGAIQGHVDRDRIAAMGMSLGGSTSLRLAFQSGLIKAGVSLDGNYYGTQHLEGIDKPILFMHSDEPAHMAERLLPLIKTTTDFYAVKVRSCTHPNFTDYSEVWVDDEPEDKVLGGIDPDVMERIMSTLILDFFNKCFKCGKPQYLDSGFWDDYAVIAKTNQRGKNINLYS